MGHSNGLCAGGVAGGEDAAANAGGVEGMTGQLRYNRVPVQRQRQCHGIVGP